MAKAYIKNSGVLNAIMGPPGVAGPEGPEGPQGPKGDPGTGGGFKGPIYIKFYQFMSSLEDRQVFVPCDENGVDIYYSDDFNGSSMDVAVQSGPISNPSDLDLVSLYIRSSSSDIPAVNGKLFDLAGGAGFISSNGFNENLSESRIFGLTFAKSLDDYGAAYILNSLGSGSIPNLQQVLDTGNESTKDLHIKTTSTNGTVVTERDTAVLSGRVGIDLIQTDSSSEEMLFSDIAIDNSQHVVKLSMYSQSASAGTHASFSISVADESATNDKSSVAGTEDVRQAFVDWLNVGEGTVKSVDIPLGEELISVINVDPENPLVGSTSLLQNAVSSAQTALQPAHNTSGSSHEDMRLEITQAESEISTLNSRVSAVEGIGGYVKSHDFGVAEPVQSDITTYVKTQIWPDDPESHPDTDIFNGTRVTNTFDGTVWILANTPNTDPAVFEWEPAGSFSVAIANDTTAGIVLSSSDDYKVSVESTTGKMSVNGLDSLAAAVQGAVATSGATMTGPLISGGDQVLSVGQVRNVVASTTDLEAGVSPLETGAIYLVYV